METILSIALGIGLSAACGLRVFVPFLVAGLASWLGVLPLSEGFGWIGTLPAIMLFGSATVLEIAAYYVPWLDNVLDSIATPAAIVAGVVAAASVLTDLPPLLKWSVALIGGGGAAGAVQGATAVTRAVSTMLTGGAGNPVVATIEWVGSAVTSLLSIFLPLLGIAFVVLFLFVGWRIRGRVRANGSPPHDPSSPVDRRSV